MFGVFTFLEGAGNCAVVATEFTGFIDGIIDNRPVDVRVFELETSDFAIRELETDFGSIATVNWVADSDILAQHFLHVASIIIIDALDNIAIIVFDVHVFDFLVFTASTRAEGVILCLGNLGAVFLVNTDILIPVAVFAGGIIAVFIAVTILRILDLVAIFVFFETVIVDTGFVEKHAAVGAFVDAEFGRDDAGFSAAAFLDFGTTFNNLAHDCSFAGVAEFTSSSADKTVEFVRIAELFFGGAEVAAK